MPKPGWCTLKAESILSVSENGLSEKFPDLTKCFFVNCPRSNRAEYRRYLGLDDDVFSEFCRTVAHLFDDKKLATDSRFVCIEDILAVSRFLRNVEGIRVVGIYTDDDIFEEYRSEGTFDTVGAGMAHSLSSRKIGCDILGCESLDHGYSCFDTYIINSLNEKIGQRAELKVDEHSGLLQNTYEETKHFCDMISGMGEPVIWTPFEVYEILI